VGPAINLPLWEAIGQYMYLRKVQAMERIPGNYWRSIDAARERESIADNVDRWKARAWYTLRKHQALPCPPLP
jgi:hypothetical protein